VCIDADSSVLKLISEDVDPAVTSKKRLQLELDSRLTGDDRDSTRAHYGLLRANNRSTLDFSYLDNQWCNIGNRSNCSGSNLNNTCDNISDFNVMNIVGDSNFSIRLYSDGTLEKPIKTDCEDSFVPTAQYLKSYEFTSLKDSVSCGFGSSPVGASSCYSNLGNVYIYNDNPEIGAQAAYQTIPLFTLQQRFVGENEVRITNGRFFVSTAGGEDIEINTSGFKSITSVKVGGSTVAINSFNPNYDANRQRLIITAPPHTKTDNLPANQQVLIEVTGLSLLDPTKQVKAENMIIYSVDCPKNYFQVAANSALSTEPFCVMRYEAKDQSSRTVSEPTGLPLVNISRAAANAKCQSISPYYRLMSNAEWQAMARQAEPLIGNKYDTDSDIGSTEDTIFRGHSDNQPTGPLAASNENDPCFGTDVGVTSETTCGSQFRYLFISPFNNVWDMAGNVAEWVSDSYTVSGTPPASSYISQITPDLRADFGPAGDYSTLTSADGHNGFGYLNFGTGTGRTYGRARGGSYLDGDKSGLFAADVSLNPEQGYPHVGFRCVVVPPATVP
jgi:formylglycine-generating enzyme required for sulfatase activity